MVWLNDTEETGMNKRKVNKAIQVALVEDDPNLRANLTAMLNSSSGFHCQAAYSDGKAALRGIPANRPDVVLMDINLPGMLGTECVRQLKALTPNLPVLMLTVYEDSEQIFKSLMSGATGYLLKRTSKDKLLEAIREVNAGGAPMSRQIARRVVQYFQKVNELPADTAERLGGGQFDGPGKRSSRGTGQGLCLQGNCRPVENQL